MDEGIYVNARTVNKMRGPIKPHSEPFFTSQNILTEKKYYIRFTKSG